MSIERDERIQFHEQGTLTAVTRWVAGHDEGLAEWLKNTRRAYQPDRANVSDDHKIALLLFKDARGVDPARIGLLDVGGATLEDVSAWSTWQDPDAASRGSGLRDEENQGNGGKAYMFRMFRGTARILGVRNGKRNCKGFEGDSGTVARGTPGFMPDVASGREVAIGSVSAELARALAPYGVERPELPDPLQRAIMERGAFTLVEGTDPLDIYHGQIGSDDLMARTLRHDQSTLAIQQLRLYAIHNGNLLNSGKPLELPPIEPFPGLEGPFVYPIPEELPLEEGGMISTTEGNRKPRGRLILQTSRENMQRAHKNLKPRWRISYRASGMDMIGSKPISDFAPTSPGAHYVYGGVELPALSPGYVEHGRRTPKPGPLVDALDAFVTEKIRDIAKRISDQKKMALDDRSLDEVQLENQKLDDFKNKFLPSDNGAGGGGNGDGGAGGRHHRTREVDFGTTPAVIELSVPAEGVRIACGVELHARYLLNASVLDSEGKPVRAALMWHALDQHVVRFSSGDLFVARAKGRTEIWASARVGRETLESAHAVVEVVLVDHVLLTPRKLDIKLGERATILAEVTDDDGHRFTDVLLKWRHEADDQLVVRVGPRGTVTGTRIGRTMIFAGGLGTGDAEVWSRIPSEVEVLKNPELSRPSGGFPRLLVTGRDIDPETGQVREGDPESPALWQEPPDFANNVWWLNLQSPEALFAFSQRDSNAALWRNFHAGIVMDLVVQVQMQTQYTRKGEREGPTLWGMHRNSLDVNRVTTVQQMWEQFEPYVREGAELTL